MQGTVLDFNIQENRGVITGEDGKRYQFEGKEWKEQEPPQRGEKVDFEVDESGKDALSIYAIKEKKHSSGEKSKIVAGLLAIFVGVLGIHKFYLGCNKEGIIMLVVWLVGLLIFGIPSLIIAVIAFIEGVIYLTKSDEDFETIYIKNQKCWF